jgi:hypothetical protein
VAKAYTLCTDAKTAARLFFAVPQPVQKDRLTG